MSALFSGHYLRNRSTLDIGVLGYIGIVQHKEHSPEVWSVPPVTPCIHNINHKITKIQLIICMAPRFDYKTVILRPT